MALRLELKERVLLGRSRCDVRVKDGIRTVKADLVVLQDADKPVLGACDALAALNVLADVILGGSFRDEAPESALLVLVLLGDEVTCELNWPVGAATEDLCHARAALSLQRREPGVNFH